MNEVNCQWNTDRKGDENNNPKQILACVGGIKSEYFDDDQEHVVVLKKMY